MAGAAALVSGTTIGAGVLALPTATAPAGLIPSSIALCIAWFYMTMSGLLIAELAINRIGETGNPGVGLLELYKTTLNKELAWVGSAAFLFLHYAVMVAYISQGGANLGTFFSDVGLDSIASIHGMDQVLFAAAAGSLVYFAKPSQVENVNNMLVIGVIATFLGIIGVGAGAADFPALIAPVNQHPVSSFTDVVLIHSNCLNLPCLTTIFLSGNGCKRISNMLSLNGLSQCCAYGSYTTRM